MTNPYHNDVILMLSASVDSVGSRLMRESIFSVAMVVAGSYEILLFPVKRGKIRMTETVKGVRGGKGGVA